MICLVTDSQSRLSTTIIIIFYTCVWIPFRELKRSILDIMDTIFSCNQNDKGPTYHEGSCFVDLPAARFEDVKCRSSEDEVEEEVCCVCLVEFDKEDVVSQLPKCCHVFHMGCIEEWLNRNRFSCPLCRSLLLSVSSSPCKSSHWY